MHDIYCHTPGAMTAPGDRVLALINNKGGVGKTTTTANLAGQLAAAGYRTLAVDLDPQGHLGVPLGYYHADVDDYGMYCVTAIENDEEFTAPIENIRPGLDVYPGGPRLIRLQGIEMSGEVMQGVVTSFAEKLAHAASNYDLVLIDCPPGDRLIQQMALAAARFVIVPIDTGIGATESVKDHLAPLVARVRRFNPELTYLGAVICKQPQAATRILRNTRLRLDEFAEHVPVFEAVIRNAAKASQDCEYAGQLVHEMVEHAPTVDEAYFHALRTGQDRTDLTRVSGTATGLADDYRSVAAELLHRIASHEQTTPIRKSQ